MSEPIPQLLTMALVRKHYVPLSPSTLYEMISKGTFPTSSMQVGRKIRMWHREVVEAWVETHRPAGGKGAAHVA